MPVTAADLASIPLFASLDDGDREELACWFDTQDASAGVRLTGEGAAGYSFFVLADGGAVVTVDDAEVATLDPGDFFGELAIIGDGRRTATVTTTTPSRLFVMFGTEFRKLQQSHPEIAAQIEAAIVSRA
jgi:CRP-like cAMP-binding protein